MNDIATKIQTGMLAKPTRDTNFAQASSKILMDVVEQNGWSMALGGKKKHLMFEAWQTVGKYYGYTVKTGEANYVEYGEVKGFEAKAWVIDNKTGIEIGGAEAACLSDEPNWKNKPLFQQKSMAQTRAGSKALRQILGFVVALAGYSPTPAEEMIKEEPWLERPQPSIVQEAEKTFGVSANGCNCGTTGKYHARQCPQYTNPYAKTQAEDLTYQEHLDSIKNE